MTRDHVLPLLQPLQPTLDRSLPALRHCSLTVNGCRSC